MAMVEATFAHNVRRGPEAISGMGEQISSRLQVLQDQAPDDIHPLLKREHEGSWYIFPCPKYECWQEHPAHPPPRSIFWPCISSKLAAKPDHNTAEHGWQKKCLRNPGTSTQIATPLASRADASCPRSRRTIAVQTRHVVYSAAPVSRMSVPRHSRGPANKAPASPAIGHAILQNPLSPAGCRRAGSVAGDLQFCPPR